MIPIRPPGVAKKPSRKHLTFGLACGRHCWNLPGRRLREVILVVETIAIIGLLYWLVREEQANPVLRSWLSSNFPLGLYLLDPWGAVGISGTLIAIVVGWIVVLEKGEITSLGSRGTLLAKNWLKRTFQRFPLRRGYDASAVLLISFGTGLTLYSLLVINVVALEALALSCIILGFTAVSLPRHMTGSDGLRAMLQGTTLNIEALLEPYAVARAIYLPPEDGGMISAYVPLGPNTGPISVKEIRKAPRGIVDNDQRGVLVYPVGAELSRIPEVLDGFSLEERLSYVLVESADLCSRVRAEETGSLIIVAMRNVKMEIEGHRYLDSLGSLPTSLAACVIATLYMKPVRLLEERGVGDSNVARFTVGHMNLLED